MGGRKFAFQNVGPLGCLPMIKQMYPQLNGGCNNDLLIVARMHNRALSNVLKKLALKFTDFKYSIFDYYSALDERINNPSNHGVQHVNMIFVYFFQCYSFAKTHELNSYKNSL